MALPNQAHRDIMKIIGALYTYKPEMTSVQLETFLGMDGTRVSSCITAANKSHKFPIIKVVGTGKDSRYKLDEKYKPVQREFIHMGKIHFLLSRW
ncbi:TPA: hypothetical protein P0E12_004964 [Vibrio harveyi]|nr:hypothetical protein [Vibrio harveyi]